YTSDDLIEAVRVSTFSPDASDITPANILAWGDQVLQTLIASTIRPGREGTWLAHEDVALVPGTLEYPVPLRALGRTVRGVM
ncbi:hypothetical protein, partial [Streptococcus pseudopneumoniae]|uniref:hypothetical protein n=1 Tax=Streptococcus pseudopneumoniae TaxID=257758 RepID=UPI0018B07120